MIDAIKYAQLSTLEKHDVQNRRVKSYLKKQGRIVKPKKRGDRGIDFYVDGKAVKAKHWGGFGTEIRLDMVNSFTSSKKGWFSITTAKLLYFHCLENDVVYVLDIPGLRMYVKTHDVKRSNKGCMNETDWGYQIELKDLRMNELVIEELYV